MNLEISDTDSREHPLEIYSRQKIGATAACRMVNLRPSSCRVDRIPQVTVEKG